MPTPKPTSEPPALPEKQTTPRRRAAGRKTATSSPDPEELPEAPEAPEAPEDRTAAPTAPTAAPEAPSAAPRPAAAPRGLRPSPRTGPPMKILVVGAGAVGSFLGTLLAAAGNDVTLVRIFELSSNEPMTLVSPDGAVQSFPLRRVSRTEKASEPDLILFAVKMPSLREAIVPTLIWPTVPTLTVENGIGAEGIAAELRPQAPLIAGSLTAPIELVSENEVRWLGKGGLGLSALTPDAWPSVRTLRREFGRVGFRTAELRDASSMKWSKLLANLIANATGAVLDMDAEEIYRDPRLFAIERRQLCETLDVMHQLGLKPVGLPGAAVPWLARVVRLPTWLSRPILARIVGGARAGKLPSLRVHVRAVEAGAPPVTAIAGEPTEVRWMNGAVARFGVLTAVPTPVNNLLAELVDDVAADPERRAALRRNPDRLLAELLGTADSEP
jgi:2-dehydropantoate 2-reductase